VPSFSPELLLAAACASWPPSKRRTEAVCSEVSRVLDWARFLRVVKRHGVVGLVDNGLKRAHPDIPLEVVQEIRYRATTLVGESLAMAAEAARLQRLFDEAGIAVLFLKGASLAKLAYGTLGLRSAKDIDLLVSPEVLPSALALIARAGYRRFDPPPNISDARLRLLMSLRRDLCFINEVTGHQLELHWRLFLNPHAMDEVSIMAASRRVPLTGGAIGLRTLGDEDLFTYLCVHGALHCWNQLKWLADIGALVATVPDGGVERLYCAAEVRGAGRAAAQALLLCQRLLNSPIPGLLVTKFSRSSTISWLENTALRAMAAGRGERAPRDVRFGTTRGSLSNFLLRRNWRYRVAELRGLLTNESDVLAVPLPERLRFLYPIMRLPLWVWRHASQRDAS
jgi:Uncharacterised nucleotidyltransferase